MPTILFDSTKDQNANERRVGMGASFTFCFCVGEERGISSGEGTIGRNGMSFVSLTFKSEHSVDDALAVTP